MAFKKFKLSPESIEKIRWTRAEMIRLYTLPDRWLAEEVLRLCRQARRDRPGHFNTGRMSYDQSLVLDVGPEIAKRLGARLFLQEERLTADIIRQSDQKLRNYAGLHIANSSRFADDIGHTRPSAWSLLTREICHGNPVMIAMDRIAAPSNEPDDYDIAAQRMLEISVARQIEPIAYWSPEFEMASNRQALTKADRQRDDEESNTGPRFI